MHKFVYIVLFRKQNKYYIQYTITLFFLLIAQIVRHIW